MQILSNRSTKNGAYIHGECVMLRRDGVIFQCIDNLYHPNPGTESDQYSEIERTVDWLYANHITQIIQTLDKWVCHKVAELVDSGYTDIDDVILDVMYSDIYEPCSATKNAVQKAFEICKNQMSCKQYARLDELTLSREIASYLNENFLRVRAGGKLNPCGTNSIYFRISSHGFNWYNIIVNFLWDVFRSIDNMPDYVWIGHDAETNPPEIVLFDGTPHDLFERYDTKIFRSSNIIWV